MDHRDINASAVVDELYSVGPEMQEYGRIIDQTLGLQQDHPGRRAHQERGPEWEQHKNHEDVAHPLGGIGQEIGHGIAQQNTTAGNHHTQENGAY